MLQLLNGMLGFILATQWTRAIMKIWNESSDLAVFVETQTSFVNNFKKGLI
jgi:hypothetical protein